MAIIPADTSGLGISTGERRGYAQILGRSTFDPVAFVQNVADQQEAQRIKELDKKLKLQDRNSKVKLYIPKVNEHNKEELTKMYDDFEETLTKMAVAGMDISSPEAQGFLAKAQMAMQEKEGEGVRLAELVEKNRDLADAHPDKFDREKVNEWMEGIDKNPDISSKLKYATGNSPFPAPEYDLNEPIRKMAGDMAERTLEKGIETVTDWNPEQVKNMVRNTLTGMPSNELQQVFETGKKKGLWEDYGGMEKEYENRMWAYMPEKRVTDEPKSSGGANVIVGGYKVPEKVTVEGRSRWDTSNGNVDEVSISYNSKDVPPFEVEKNAGGEKIRFAPIKWFRDQNGNWMVEGKSYGRTGEEKIKPASFKSMDDFFNEQKKNPDAEIVVDGDKLTIFKPLKTEIVPYDLNDITFKSHLEGFDLKEFEKGWNKTNAGKKPSKPSAKGVTDVSNIFGGQ